jgi:hypothetical protein
MFYNIFLKIDENYKHIQIKIENESSIGTFDQSWQVYIIFIDVMFLKLINPF